MGPLPCEDPADKDARYASPGSDVCALDGDCCHDNVSLEREALDEEKRSDDAIWINDQVDVQYTVNQSPPVHMCILLGFQHYISMFLATLTVPILLSPAICMDKDNVGKSELTGTLFVASGIITLMQTFFGCRLPIVQGGTFAVLVPTLAYLSLPQWTCPTNILTQAELDNVTVVTNQSYILAGSAEHREIWQIRLREIQGSIMCAALFEVILGATGLVGIMLRFIGPLCIFPTVTLLGLSLFKSATNFAAGQWWICIMCISLMVIFSQYLGRIGIPCYMFNRKKHCNSTKYQFFKMFPIILAVLLSWLLCYVLTVTGVFPDDPDAWGYKARTDLRNDAMAHSPWFRVPYPFQWGLPTASVSAVCAILSGILATTIESVGDYHACAKLAGAPPPPIHAVNRGILVEGLGSIIDGMLGTGNGTTSTSINVGVVGLTKVGSRRVVHVSALFMITFGIFTKFGALFVTIPDPVIAATFFILFSMIVAVGISNLQYVDMNSGRNLFIIGFSLFVGLSVPQWVSSGDNKSQINTGVQTVDNVFQVLLSTSMFVGGMVGLFLDNTIPGSDEERGLAVWKQFRKATSGSGSGRSKELTDLMSSVYDLPLCMPRLRKLKWTRYVPFCPTYGMDREEDDGEGVALKHNAPMAGEAGDIEVKVAVL